MARSRTRNYMDDDNNYDAPSKHSTHNTDTEESAESDVIQNIQLQQIEHLSIETVYRLYFYKCVIEFTPESSCIALQFKRARVRLPVRERYSHAKLHLNRAYCRVLRR
ncbi:hypothetical protein J6590_098730 [Homalodisca vitripennis]|nr:hypothetical protein J6590_098730 [Homalodisca vitripennis]